MRWSQTLIPTMKENPEGAEIPSHVLMLRAGLINQLMAGAYTYLPLGYRALRKAEQIIREEMERAGAAFVLRPARPLVVGRMERDLARLEALYRQGYDETMARMTDLEAWLQG